VNNTIHIVQCVYIYSSSQQTQPLNSRNQTSSVVYHNWEYGELPSTVLPSDGTHLPFYYCLVNSSLDLGRAWNIYF